MNKGFIKPTKRKRKKIVQIGFFILVHPNLGLHPVVTLQDDIFTNKTNHLLDESTTRFSQLSRNPLDVVASPQSTSKLVNYQTNNLWDFHNASQLLDFTKGLCDSLHKDRFSSFKGFQFSLGNIQISLLSITSYNANVITKVNLFLIER